MAQKQRAHIALATRAAQAQMAQARAGRDAAFSILGLGLFWFLRKTLLKHFWYIWIFFCIIMGSCDR